MFRTFVNGLINIDTLINELTYQDLIQYLIEDNHISMEEAMELVYNSKTFEKLNDFKTHLYYESSSYVYEYLKEELNENK